MGSLQNQLASFRITELKHVLSRLGLSKQGKKQVCFAAAIFNSYLPECMWCSKLVPMIIDSSCCHKHFFLVSQGNKPSFLYVAEEEQESAMCK
jgi:hypothetical protein